MTVKYQHFDLLSFEKSVGELVSDVSQLFLKSPLTSQEHTSCSLEK